ncbi:MAG: DUF309 domain-containing protein [Myxococcota bacterium]
MTTAWQNGLKLIRERAYWDAHEQLEQVWHATSEGQARDATQALIQFAAAAYKIDQARQGRAPESMQRGMGKLIDRALALLDGTSVERVGWNAVALARALEELDEVRLGWKRGSSICATADEASEVAARLVDALDGVGEDSST